MLAASFANKTGSREHYSETHQANKNKSKKIKRRDTACLSGCDGFVGEGLEEGGERGGEGRKRCKNGEGRSGGGRVGGGVVSEH